MKSRIEQLMERCMGEGATEEERKELLGLLQLSENEEEARGLIRAALEDTATRGGDEGDMDEESAGRVLATIYGEGHGRGLIPVLLKWGLAAAVLLSVVWGTSLLFRQKEPVKAVAQQRRDSVYDIPPGRNKATLTLASGEAIQLDDAKAGNIADDGGAEIRKAGNGGALSYRALGREGKEVFNTITTPRGANTR
ncbi:hypothetical protein ACQ86N_06730 [Puia sp. P3]|uniref:hypothetical protein n=1 Tax=Puia sp. P3 TaxID=3423952 RepID=UPI003D67D428